jgi:hypothetical protein
MSYLLHAPVIYFWFLFQSTLGELCHRHESILHPGMRVKHGSIWAFSSTAITFYADVYVYRKERCSNTVFLKKAVYTVFSILYTQHRLRLLYLAATRGWPAAIYYDTHGYDEFVPSEPGFWAGYQQQPRPSTAQQARRSSRPATRRGRGRQRWRCLPTGVPSPGLHHHHLPSHQMIRFRHLKFAPGRTSLILQSTFYYSIYYYYYYYYYLL